MDDTKNNKEHYFHKSKTWYFNFWFSKRYEVILSYFLLISSFLMIIMCSVGLYGMFPLYKSHPLVLYDNHKDFEYPLIRSLDIEKGDSINSSVSKYLIKIYVKKREFLDQGNFQENVLYVKNNSSPDAIVDFMKEVSGLNNYQKNNKDYKKEFVSVSVLNLNLIAEGTSGVAEVKILYKESGEYKEKYIVINFTVSDIVSSISRSLPLEFLITRYYYKVL